MSDRVPSWIQKKIILVIISFAISLLVLVSPIIPIQSTVTKTRTRNLKYTSNVYGVYNIPKFVKVTNSDSIGGCFSVIMKKWYNPPLGQRQLEDTHTQSSSISAGTTHDFYLPDDWSIMAMYSFTYSVSAPTTQETYKTTQTEYNSILNLILFNLR